jgi:hypothetical protein
MESIAVKPVQCGHVCHYPGMRRIYGATSCSWCGHAFLRDVNFVIYDDMVPGLRSEDARPGHIPPSQVPPEFHQQVPERFAHSNMLRLMYGLGGMAFNN